MLIDYLEEISENLKNLEKQLVQLEKDYRLFGDREIREQMNTVKKDIKKIMANALGQLYLHLQELFLIKKYFPVSASCLNFRGCQSFFQVLITFQCGNADSDRCNDSEPSPSCCAQHPAKKIPDLNKIFFLGKVRKE